MGLYKRDKVWWMRIFHDGRQIRSSTETTDKKLAERIYAKVLTEITEKKWFDVLLGDEKTFGDLMEKYLTEYSPFNKAPSTRSREKSTVKLLLSYFGKRLLREIASRDIAQYKTDRRVAGASPKTVNNELVLMGHAFNLAMKEWEWVRDNPVSRVSKYRVNNIIERWLSEGEESRLLKTSPDWLQEIILFAAYTGLRQGEILNLKWPLVDLERRTLTILEQKNHGRDTLPLNEVAMEVLEARNKIRSISCDHVFFNKVSKRHDSANLIRAFRVARKKAKLEDFRFHDLRHTFATRMIQAGVDIYKVQRLLRHKSPQMTQRYAHHYPESLRDGVELLDCVRNKKSTILAHSKEKGLSRFG